MWRKVEDQGSVGAETAWMSCSRSKQVGAPANTHTLLRTVRWLLVQFIKNICQFAGNETI